MDASRSGSESKPAAAGTGASVFDAHDHTRLWLQSKLSGEWSAQTGASGLTEERLSALSRGFGGLDSMVKVRLLLAGLFLPRSEQTRLQPLLSELCAQAASSQDEWVRATAAAVGDFSGPLDMRSLMAQFPLVRDTVMSLSTQLVGLRTPPELLPQAEQYMHTDINRLPQPTTTTHTKQQQHFRLRDLPLTALGTLDGGLLLSGGASGGGGGGSVNLMTTGGSGVAVGGSGVVGGSGGGLGAVSGSLEPVGRRGTPHGAGGGTGGADAASILRRRADVTAASAFKDSKLGSAPPTPTTGTKLVPPVGGPPAALALRPIRPRPLSGSMEVPSLDSPGGPGVAQALGLLGRRDSQTFGTPRSGSWGGISPQVQQQTFSGTSQLPSSSLTAMTTMDTVPRPDLLPSVSAYQALHLPLQQPFMTPGSSLPAFPLSQQHGVGGGEQYAEGSRGGADEHGGFKVLPTIGSLSSSGQLPSELLAHLGEALGIAGCGAESWSGGSVEQGGGYGGGDEQSAKRPRHRE